MPGKAESKCVFDIHGIKCTKCIRIPESSEEYQTHECEPVAEVLEIRGAVL
jgi:hypothetical protein